jgi:NAD(P)H-dependent FMN reductase
MEAIMDHKQLNIGIIIGSTREGRIGDQVGQWVFEQAQRLSQHHFTLLDIKDFHLPFLGSVGSEPAIKAWDEAVSKCDGFIFITPEYNHSFPASLKNAVDVLKESWHDKAAAIISYGSMGGARAAEHLKQVLGELRVADVRTQVLFSLFDDFEKMYDFKPRALHLSTFETQLEQLISWSEALKPLRQS